MGMPNWTPGPWQAEMQRPHGETLYAVRHHTHAMVTMDPEGYLVYQHGKESIARDDDGYFTPSAADAESGILDCDPSRIENAKLISHAPTMADALIQWRVAETIGDADEMRNARAERDRILAELAGDKK